MQIYDFLKVMKVKCINTNGLSLTVNKEYQLLGVTDRSCMINDDDGYETWASMQRFEPVPNNGMSKSNSEIDTSTFNVGDLVYFPSHACGSIVKLGKGDDWDLSIFLSKGKYKCFYDVDNKGMTKHGTHTGVVHHATQENYEMLCKLYPHIEFESPPKPLTGNDLTKGMFERGDFAVVCKCSDTSESSAITFSPLRLIVGYSNGRFEENNGKCWDYAVPFDPKTGIPLTEDVLNETVNK